MSDEINSENATEGNEKKSSKKWLAGLVIAALILLWVAPPLAAELYLRDNIGNLMRADSPDEVNLDTNTFKLLSGSFDNLEVKGSNLKIGNLKIDKYELIASSGKVSIMETLREKDVVVKESPVADLTMYVAIEDMKELLEAYYESLNDMEVVAKEGYLEISGVSDTPRGKSVPIVFEVELSSSDWSSLQVEVTDLSQADTYALQLNEEEVEELIEVYTIDISFENTSPAIFINSVNITTQEVVITANTSLS